MVDSHAIHPEAPAADAVAVNAVAKGENAAAAAAAAAAISNSHSHSHQHHHRSHKKNKLPSHKTKNLNKIARKLTKFLRHGTAGRTSNIGALTTYFTPDGSVLWTDLKRLLLEQPVSLDELHTMLTSDQKGRFFTTGTEENLRLGACQGHSKVLYTHAQLDILRTTCTPIIHQELQPTLEYAYHGTTQEAWQSIQHSGSVQPGTRQHVHLNPSKAKTIEQVRSTLLRHKSQDKTMGVVLTIQLHHQNENNTTQDASKKIEFYLSKNNVVLSEQSIPVAPYIIEAEFITVDGSVVRSDSTIATAVAANDPPVRNPGRVKEEDNTTTKQIQQQQQPQQHHVEAPEAPEAQEAAAEEQYYVQLERARRGKFQKRTTKENEGIGAFSSVLARRRYQKLVLINALAARIPPSATIEASSPSEGHPHDAPNQTKKSEAAAATEDWRSVAQQRNSPVWDRYLSTIKNSTAEDSPNAAKDGDREEDGEKFAHAETVFFDLLPSELLARREILRFVFHELDLPPGTTASTNSSMNTTETTEDRYQLYVIMVQTKSRSDQIMVKLYDEIGFPRTFH